LHDQYDLEVAMAAVGVAHALFSLLPETLPMFGTNIEVKIVCHPFGDHRIYRSNWQVADMPNFVGIQARPAELHA
jgi:hypothetical protein